MIMQTNCEHCKGRVTISDEGIVGDHKPPLMRHIIDADNCFTSGHTFPLWGVSAKADCLKCDDSNVILTPQGEYRNHYDGNEERCDFSGLKYEDLAHPDFYELADGRQSKIGLAIEQFLGGEITDVSEAIWEFAFPPKLVTLLQGRRSTSPPSFSRALWYYRVPNQLSYPTQELGGRERWDGTVTLCEFYQDTVANYINKNPSCFTKLHALIPIGVDEAFAVAE